MKNDVRLQSWLELADELESFDQFMRANKLAPLRTKTDGQVESLDAGAAAARRMRAVAANPLTWYGWKRDGMQGEVRAELRTFYRWIGEAGGESWYKETEAGREMLARIERIERKFKQLSGAKT